MMSNENANLGATDATDEDRLYDIVDRCHVGTRRMNDEPLAQFATRIGLDIERRIALLLLYLKEIETLDLDEEDAS